MIFKLKDFNILRRLCNRSKHIAASVSVGVLGTLYGSKIDDWSDMDSVADLDRGPPIAYSVDDRDLMDVIRTVIKFYDERWFPSRGSS